MSKSKLQEKVAKVYQSVKDNFYLCRPDLRSDNHTYNSHLLFGVLTQLNNGTQLIYGSYGGGKTTSSKYLNSIFYHLPLDIITGSIARGSAGLIEEKFIGRPDYGKMNKGEEDVVWQKFCLIPPKIFDELPRTPEGAQSIVLAGIEEGSWTYLNGHVDEGRRPFYATANYLDRGSFTIIPALLERFDVATLAKFPGLVNSKTISRRYNREQEELLKDKKISEEIIKILLSKEDYGTIHDRLNPLRQLFLETLNRNGIPTLTDEEKTLINDEISKIGIEDLAELYCTFLTAELNVSSRGNYLRNLMSQKAESRRIDQAVLRYAQSLSWLNGRDKVNLEDVLNIAPYALWHKVEWKDNIRGRFADYDKPDRDLMITKRLLGDGIGQNESGLKTRVLENAQNYRQLAELIKNDKEEEAKTLLRNITTTSATHPYFNDIKTELEGFEE